MAKPATPASDLIAALIGEDGLLAVRVTPNAKAEMLSIEEGALKARVTVVPEDGKANKAVIALLAKALGVPKSSISLVRGQTSRDKQFRISR